MAKKLKHALISKQEAKIHRYLIAFPVIAFAIKLITVFNIQGGGWLGADGENYLKGVDGLYADGLFSKADILNYWPAGYPILIWLLVLITTSKFIYLISFIQTIFFAYSTYFLTKAISKTGVAWLAVPASFFISFNPTLSLSSLAIGYETPVASCFMMTLGIILVSRINPEKSQYLYAFFAGAWIALASFMQPRYLLAGIVIFILWGASFIPKKTGLTVSVLALVVMLISPIALILRNEVATNKATISTNLGVTMSIGAGDVTKGGYAHTGPEVPCNPVPPATAVTDSQKVICVLKWYASHPIKTLKLALYKSEFFWSPWSGPLANGTMARNPWLKVSPTQNISKSQSGVNLVSGPIGKLISWLWIIGQIGLLIYGFSTIRRIDKESRILADCSLAAITIAWLISIGTIGDHRFRLPTMSISLLLQVAGLWQLKKRVSKAL